MRRLVIGVDVGGTRTKIGLVDLIAGKVIKSLIEPTEKKAALFFERKMEVAINSLISIAKHDRETIEGIGFGISGFVWPNGTVDSTYGFIEFMEDYPLGEIMQAKLQLPCKVDNDARTIALGEALFGQGRNHARMLMLTLGTGFGIGFTHHGKLTEQLPYAHMGGHLTITQDKGQCYCGKSGCLESLVSATGILAAAERVGLKGINGLPLTVDKILELANNGDSKSETVVKEWLAHLKTGIGNYINIYAPDIIVLGGGVSKGLKNYVSFLEDTNHLKPYKNYQVKIRVSELEEQSGI